MKSSFSIIKTFPLYFILIKLTFLDLSQEPNILSFNVSTGFLSSQIGGFYNFFIMIDFNEREVSRQRNFYIR